MATESEEGFHTPQISPEMFGFKSEHDQTTVNTQARKFGLSVFEEFPFFSLLLQSRY